MSILHISRRLQIILKRKEVWKVWTLWIIHLLKFYPNTVQRHEGYILVYIEGYGKQKTKLKKKKNFPVALWSLNNFSLSALVLTFSKGHRDFLSSHLVVQTKRQKNIYLSSLNIKSNILFHMNRLFFYGGSSS